MTRKLTLLVLTIVCCTMAHAHVPNKVTIELKDLDLPEAILSLSRRAGQSVLIEPSVRQTCKVTLNLSETPFENALDTICDLSGVAWKKAGPVYRIFTDTSPFTFSAYAGQSPRLLFSSPEGSARAFRFYGPDLPGTFSAPLPPHLLQRGFVSPRTGAEIEYLPRTHTSSAVNRIRSLIAHDQRNALAQWLVTPRREERSTFTCPRCKKSATVVSQNQNNNCAKCNREFQRDWTFCPYDGSRRTTPIDEWKVCPFCAKGVK